MQLPKIWNKNTRQSCRKTKPCREITRAAPVHVEVTKVTAHSTAYYIVSYLNNYSQHINFYNKLIGYTSLPLDRNTRERINFAVSEQIRKLCQDRKTISGFLSRGKIEKGTFINTKIVATPWVVPDTDFDLDGKDKDAQYVKKILQKLKTELDKLGVLCQEAGLETQE